MTVGWLYLLVLVPATALAASGYALASTQRSAERVREIERQRPSR